MTRYAPGDPSALWNRPMSASAHTIWRVPAFLPYLQPPLTEALVAAAEATIGYKLPSEYLALLREQNGGYIRFELPEIVHDTIAGIGPNFPSLTNFDWDEVKEYVSYPLDGLVPFDGDGHWHLCLDYRKNPDTPAITYADVECDTESSVADSFCDYLALLRPADSGNYALEGVPDIEWLKGELTRSLGVAFEPTDTWANGYPIERVRLGNHQDPQWLWISPNTVRRGFVRADDPKYEVLKDLMPGTADRFPGLPSGSYILSTTDRVRRRVLDACEQVGFPARPLVRNLSQ